jgi:NTP pyrophosphatase (non-canonical NTP hydrolase)
MSNELKELRNRLREFAAVRGWDGFHTARNLAMALVGEVGELVAELQWIHDADVTRHLEDSAAKARMADEMADVLIYLVRLADVCEVDLLTEAHAKVGRNELRFPPMVRMHHCASISDGQLSRSAHA